MKIPISEFALLDLVASTLPVREVRDEETGAVPRLVPKLQRLARA